MSDEANKRLARRVMKAPKGANASTLCMMISKSPNSTMILDMLEIYTLQHRGATMDELKAKAKELGMDAV